MKVCNEIGFEGDGEVKAMRKKPIDIMAMQEDCWIIQGDLVDNPVHSKYQHVKHIYTCTSCRDQGKSGPFFKFFLCLPIGCHLLDFIFWYIMYIKTI